MTSDFILPQANNKYLDTRLGSKLGTDLSLHEGILIGFMADNHYIRNNEVDEKLDEIEKMKRYSFVMEEKNILYYNDYIKKVAKTVPITVLEQVTDLRSTEYGIENEEGEFQTIDQLVAFLPVSFRLYNSKCQSYRLILEHLLKVFSDMDYMCMKTPLGVFQVDQAIENLFELEKQFWNRMNVKRYESDNKAPAPEQAKACLNWLLSRRIKNKTYKHTNDYDQIIKDIDDAEFQDASDSWYSAGVKPEDTFEKESSFQKWKDTLGISPLPVEDYQKFFTYEQTKVLFRCLEIYPEYFIKICGLFMSSFQLCHLIIFGGELQGTNWIIDKFVNFMADIKYKRIWDKIFDGYYRSDGSSSFYNDGFKDKISHGGQRIFRLMSAILYFEERLLAGKITNNHRCLLPISFSSSLPFISLRNNYNYYNYNYGLSKMPFWYQTCANFYFPLNLNTKINYNTPYDYKNTATKICDLNEFNLRFNILSGGMLDGLDWKGLDVYFTGAGAEMCYYRNGYFPFEFLVSEHPNNPYLGSDIDLGIRIDPTDLGLDLKEDDNEKKIHNQEIIQAELRKRADLILNIVKNNYGLKDLKLISRNTRWIIKHPDLPRELDIFSFSDQPGALIYNYHMPTCRVVAQPIPSDLGGQVRMLSSACLSAMMGTCIDRRWFTSKKSIHNRIMKQFKRGIGLIMNPHETKVVVQYIYHYQKSNPDQITILNSVPRLLEIDGQIPNVYWKRFGNFFYNNGIGFEFFMSQNNLHNNSRNNRKLAELVSLLNFQFK